MMRSTACFHSHHAGCQPRSDLDHAVPVHPPAHDDLACVVQTNHAAAVLTQINTKDRDLHRHSPPLRLPRTAYAAEVRGGPFHKTLPHWSLTPSRPRLATSRSSFG